MTPLKYFKQFWSDEITDLLVNQTNLYNVQKTGSSIHTTHAEIEQFIGIQMVMSVIKMPRFEMFWNNETWYEPIASTYPLKRYKKLCEFLHVVDNTEKDKPEKKGDKYF